jgi:hypothetical protein
LKVSNGTQWIEAIRSFPDGPVLVTLSTVTATRSRESNNLYWKFYVGAFSEETGNDPNWVHSYFKRKLLPVPSIVIADAHGEIVDEAPVEPTTTILTPQEFSDYLRRIEIFASELGISVGPPDRDER